MNSKKLILIFCLALSFPVFAQKADMSLVPYRQGDLWGYASADRTIVLKPEYAEAGLFYEGLAAVKKADKFGFINMEGKVVIPFRYFKVTPFRYGFFAAKGNAKTADGDLHQEKSVLFAGASLTKDGYEICIDTKGQRMVKCPAIPESSAPDMNQSEKIIVKTNYSTIHKTGLFDKIVDDYKMVPGADATYYIATRGNNYGVFNNTFDIILPFEYTMIKKKNIAGMTYLLAEKNGLHGVFFGNGSPYITVENKKLQAITVPNSISYFIVGQEGKIGVKDLTHKYVVESKYADVAYDSTGTGFILTAEDGTKGFWFLSGKTVEPKYVEVKALPGGDYIKVKTQAGKWGYVNSKGLEFFEE